MTPCAACGAPQGVSAWTVIPACDAWKSRKTLMFHQSETPKSDILNRSHIPTRASIAEPTVILDSSGPATVDPAPGPRSEIASAFAELFVFT